MKDSQETRDNIQSMTKEKPQKGENPFTNLLLLECLQMFNRENTSSKSQSQTLTSRYPISNQVNMPISLSKIETRERERVNKSQLLSKFVQVNNSNVCPNQSKKQSFKSSVKGQRIWPSLLVNQESKQSKFEWANLVKTMMQPMVKVPKLPQFCAKECSLPKQRYPQKIEPKFCPESQSQRWSTPVKVAVNFIFSTPCDFRPPSPSYV